MGLPCNAKRRVSADLGPKVTSPGLAATLDWDSLRLQLLEILHGDRRFPEWSDTELRDRGLCCKKMLQSRFS